MQMSMHLVGPYLSTTRYSPKKKKLTQGQLSRLKTQHIEHNKNMKRMGCPELVIGSFDDYCLYIKGKLPVKIKSKAVDPYRSAPAVRETIRYPSLNSTDSVGVAAKKPAQVYTGKLIKGIATMHKSNMVPVFSQEQAEEISKMRRG
jgi:hypothetical protein